MHKNQEKPVKLLLTWAGSDKWYLFASVFCAFLSGLFVIGPYVGIYHLMDAVLLGTLTRKGLTDCIVLISVTTVFRMVLLGLSGVLSHKGAYNALFRVRCMIIEKLAKVPLGYVSERSTGEIKTVLNENIEKLELCLAHNIPELVSYLTGPVVIFMYLMTVNIPLALISLIPLFLDIPVMMAVFQKMSAYYRRPTPLSPTSIPSWSNMSAVCVSLKHTEWAANPLRSSEKPFSTKTEHGIKSRKRLLPYMPCLSCFWSPDFYSLFLLAGDFSCGDLSRQVYFSSFPTSDPCI